MIHFDVALTVSVMRYISDLHLGRVDPATYHSRFDVERDKFDRARFLLERIARHDAKLHAFVHVYAEEARAAAAAADEARRAGRALGPLHGVPVAVKDIVDIEGLIATGGSRVWEKRVSPLTATLLLLPGPSTWAWATLGTMVGLRIALHYAVRSRIPISGPAQPWLVPIRECASFGVWAVSFLTRRVRWGARTLVVGSDYNNMSMVKDDRT